MLTKIRRVNFNKEGKNPVYKVFLECPEGNELFVHFDYTQRTNKFGPVAVQYNGIQKGVKLAWYTREVEKISVVKFLENIARKINKKYGYELKV